MKISETEVFQIWECLGGSTHLRCTREQAAEYVAACRSRATVAGDMTPPPPSQPIRVFGCELMETIDKPWTWGMFPVVNMEERRQIVNYLRAHEHHGLAEHIQAGDHWKT